MATELVLEALDMAVEQRRPESVIHHSDQGSQYTSVAFGSRCRQMGIRPSMGSVGDAYDNAMAESFFANLECKLIDRRVRRTKTGNWRKRKISDGKPISGLSALTRLARDEDNVGCENSQLVGRPTS